MVSCGAVGVDLGRVLAVLADRGMDRVLCEGGPSLFADLVAAGLADELCLTLAPAVVAGDAPRIAHGAAPAAPVDAHLLGVLEDDGALFLRYRLG